MADTSTAPKTAPQYTHYRTVTGAVDTLPETTKAHGMNAAIFERANIQVVPSDGANPTVDVLWWSDEADAFIQEHTNIQKAGIGADTPYEFTIESLGRIFFVAVTSGVAAGQTAKIFVSGYGLDE